jgi:predicted Zn-dependent protease
MALSQAKLLPPGPISVWIDGQQHQLRFDEREIHTEPEGKLSPRAEELMVRALELGGGKEAEALLLQALELEPGNPTLENNLIAAIGMQPGRQKEAEARTEALHARLPDYLFARTALARMRIREGRLEEAKDLLNPLRERRRLHLGEFRALTLADIDLLVASGERETARSLLASWEGMEDDNPMLDQARAIIDGPGSLLFRKAREFFQRR